MTWWFTPDVTDWPKVANEPSGHRTKHWVIDETGTEWLRKQSLTWRPAELAVEALTLELAARCAYPVAYGTCCTWQENGQTVRGFVSRKFHDVTESQTSGGELIAPYINLADDLSHEEQEQQRRIQTTVAVARNALTAQEQRYNVKLIDPFVRMLVFDAWIGNSDRHSGNWAILVSSGLHGDACRLAPMYDTAGCLLAELSDATIEQRYRTGMEDDAIARYVAKCGSGFGNGTSLPGLPHASLLDELHKWPEWQQCAPGLIAFFSNNLAVVDNILGEIPDDWMSLRRKQLARRVLEERVKILQRLTP